MVWVGHGSASLLYGFDGRTRTVTSVRDLGPAAGAGFGVSELQGIAVDGRSLWIPLYARRPGAAVRPAVGAG